MSNVLSDHKQQQVLALGRLGWSLRRIQEATGIRRETAGAYLKAAGIPVRGVGGRPKVWPHPQTGHHTGGVHRLHGAASVRSGDGGASTSRPRAHGERV